LTDADWALTAIKGFTGYIGLAGPSCAWVGYKNTAAIWKVGELEKKEGGIFGLALVSVCLYSCLTDVDCALPFTIMGFGGYVVGLDELSCAFLGYSNAAKNLKMGELDNVGKAAIGMVRKNLLTLFLVAYTTPWEGGDIATATGRACLAGLFMITKLMFLTKEIELIGPDMDRTPLDLRTVICAVGAYSILAYTLRSYETQTVAMRSN
jgi:hypothetical protein